MNEIKSGLKENRKQFTLLVIVNAFVGGMVGLERTILPQIAEAEFQVAAKTAILSFIIAFGIVKAVINYFTGTMMNKFGRKNLLVAGWIFGIPVPFILMYADSWNAIVASNVLLGINQGLAWSSAVVMKIDLVKENQRGLAAGLNEFAGYIAVAVVAFITGWVASEYGLRPYPFYIGIFIAFMGLYCSLLFVKDTRQYMENETPFSEVPKMKKIFRETTWKNLNLGSVTQAGFINNLNDGMAWGIFPIFLAAKGFSLGDMAIITAIYPAVWGIGQLFTGKMSDHFCKKHLLFAGMALQGITLIVFIYAETFQQFFILASLLGAGTAMVYPTFLATVAENTNPEDRAKGLGIFRFWRDSGYAAGAIFSGIIADTFGIQFSILLAGILTVFSSIIIQYRMKCSNGLHFINRKVFLLI